MIIIIYISDIGGFLYIYIYMYMDMRIEFDIYKVKYYMVASR